MGFPVVGLAEGEGVGLTVEGLAVWGVGLAVGLVVAPAGVGAGVGFWVGLRVGWRVGLFVGEREGIGVGFFVVGMRVGLTVAALVGALVGILVGLGVGELVTPAAVGVDVTNGKGKATSVQPAPTDILVPISPAGNLELSYWPVPIRLTE